MPDITRTLSSPDGDDKLEMTEQQASAWLAAVAEARRYNPEIPDRQRDWIFTWEDETRPGRGHDLDAVHIDSDYVTQIRMDVYGHKSVWVAEHDTLHNSSDEECRCDHCEKERADEL